MSEKLGKRDIEKALRSAGYSISESKKFIGRLPRVWFDSYGLLIPGAIERDNETEAASGPVDCIASLLSRASAYVR